MHGNHLIGTHNGTERHLNILRAVKQPGRMLANVTIMTIRCCLLTKVVQQDTPATHTGLGIFTHSAQAFHIDILLAARPGKPGKLYDILDIIEQQSVGRCSVPTGTSYLLIVILNALGQIIMDYETHIPLINTHAEGNGSANHLHSVIEEILLRPVTVQQ